MASTFSSPSTVNRCACGVSSVDERQIAGVEAVDGPALGELCDHRIQVQRHLLGRRHEGDEHARRGDHTGGSSSSRD
jgi:hypothetical protein